MGQSLQLKGRKNRGAQSSTERAKERGACLLPARILVCSPGPFARARARCVSVPARVEPRRSRFLAREAANGMNSALRGRPPEFSRIPQPPKESGERRAESGERRAESGERRAESAALIAGSGNPAGCLPWGNETIATLRRWQGSCLNSHEFRYRKMPATVAALASAATWLESFQPATVRDRNRRTNIMVFTTSTTITIAGPITSTFFGQSFVGISLARNGDRRAISSRTVQGRRRGARRLRLFEK